jgi:hypothetical protein
MSRGRRRRCYLAVPQEHAPAPAHLTEGGSFRRSSRFERKLCFSKRAHEPPLRFPNQLGDRSGANPVSSSRTGSRREMGRANRHRRFPSRRWLATRQIDRPSKADSACLFRAARGSGRRAADQSHEGSTAIEVETPAGGRFTIESLGNDFDAGPDSFVDCAAAMESLDLVVTSDTAIAHLAGALGRPVFLALKRVPDWRWLMHREDCPWYPSMRLFRQTEKGDWESVFKRIASSIAADETKKDGQLTGAPRAMTTITIPGAVGELIDKITILELKESHIGEAAKLENIRRELTLLRKLKSECGLGGARLAELQAELKSMNGVLWNIENALRGHEARKDFGAAFVSLARQAYKTNDRRATLKKKINLLFNSITIEEKSYSITS